MFSGVSFLSVLTLVSTCYLIGSIPSTLIASRLTTNVDLRHFGSGSAGGTNAIRVIGPVRGVIAGLADVAKGFLCVALLATVWFQAGSSETDWKVVAGAASVAGHIWPVWAGFKGGKGVATSLGVLAALDLPAALAFSGIGLLTAVATRYVSVGSLTATVCLPLVLTVEAGMFGHRTHPALWTFAVLLPLLIIYTHRSNLRRLVRGTELRIGDRVDLGPAVPNRSNLPRKPSAESGGGQK